MPNNDGIILQPYSADLNPGDETHNAEGELSRLDCSLFPSNLLACTFIVLKCFRGEDGDNGTGSVRSPDNVDERTPPQLKFIYFFYFLFAGGLA